MINRIIEFSLKNRFIIVAVYVLIAGWGYWALLRTPLYIFHYVQFRFSCFTSKRHIPGMITIRIRNNKSVLSGLSIFRTPAGFNSRVPWPAQHRSLTYVWG